MGYQRSDRGFERDRDYRRQDYYGAEQRRSPYERSDHRRERSYRPSDYDYDDRGFFDRAGDELRSWFGDEEAERRRRMDERYAERERDFDRGSRSNYRPGVPSYFGSPAATDYGAGRGAGATSNWGLGAGRDREDWGHDPNYHAWRQRQVDALDRDYDDYRREHQERFNSDFGTWRNTRQTQRQSLGQVHEHQDVVGSDGAHVGTVDKVRDDRIILTKSDADAGGHHHSIPCSWIARVGDKVEINRTADQAQQAWRDEEQNRALWSDRDRDDSDGPHILNRSFSGTY